MSLEASHIVGAVVLGGGATLLMDFWNLFLRRAFGVSSLNYCLLGRWLRHIPSGTLRHSSIIAARKQPHECITGWIAHYSIGIVFALIFVFIASDEWLSQPTFLPALLFGAVTVVFPFFIMQPSLGLGIASSKTPNPARARLKSLTTHTVFGLGMYLCALAIVEVFGKGGYVN
jgi:Protein of unknown function (DUF2938)